MDMHPKVADKDTAAPIRESSSTILRYAGSWIWRAAKRTLRPFRRTWADASLYAIQVPLGFGVYYALRGWPGVMDEAVVMGAFTFGPAIVTGAALFVTALLTEPARMDAERSATESVLRDRVAALEEDRDSKRLRLEVQWRAYRRHWIDGPDAVFGRGTASDYSVCWLSGFRVTNRGNRKVRLSFKLYVRQGASLRHMSVDPNLGHSELVERYWKKFLIQEPGDHYFYPGHSFNLEPGESSDIGDLAFFVMCGGGTAGATSSLVIHDSVSRDATPEMPVDRPALLAVDMTVDPQVRLVPREKHYQMASRGDFTP